MKKVLVILIVTTFLKCTTSKLFKEYTLYHRDKNINYPKETITVRFVSDTTGLFSNSDDGRDTFIQSFCFSRIKDDYLIIEAVNQINQNLISLKNGDTIVTAKKQLHFFYNGDKKYLLSFKRVI
jgi:hypothetical protein